MKFIFTATMACLILLALLFSFSQELGLDALIPGFEAMKTTIVAVVFLAGALGGLFHRYQKYKNRSADDGR